MIIVGVVLGFLGLVLVILAIAEGEPLLSVFGIFLCIFCLCSITMEFKAKEIGTITTITISDRHNNIKFNKPKKISSIYHKYPWYSMKGNTEYLIENYEESTNTE